MRSIRWKLAALVIAAVGSAVLLVSATFVWSDLQLRFSSRRQELQGVAAALATTLAQPLADSDKASVARSLSAVGRIPGLTYALVTDGGGNIVQQYGFGVVVTREQGTIRTAPEIGLLSSLYLATYPLVAPIISSGAQIGELTLIADLSSLRAEAIQRLLSALLAGASAILFGVLLSHRLQTRLVSPLTTLTTAMQDVSRTKNYERRVSRTSDDEIGTLVDAFNGMLGEIRARDQSIASHNEHLESEVRHRTADLELARLTAEAATAAKSEFLATMSHEIRTPMNGMLVMAELMASADLAPRMRRNAEVLLSSGRTLLAIINDILDFSKIEAGKLELEFVPVRVHEVVDHVLKLFAARAGERGLDMAAHVAGDVPEIIAADPVRLTQILSNLVNNALKFTERGGVLIRIGFSDARLRIEVVDTGIGIPEAKLATIFEAFSQADASTTRRFGGTGIGLTICRRLVTAMGGEIAAASTHGEGTTFMVVIPVEVLSAAAAMSRASTNAGDVIIALAPSVTRDAIAAYVTERGWAPILVEPRDVRVALQDRTPRAVVVKASQLGFLHAAVPDNACRDSRRDARRASGRDTDAGSTSPAPPTVIALSDIGDSAVAGAPAWPRLLELELPLAHDDIAACLDAVVRGSAFAAAHDPPRARRAAAVPALRFAGCRVLAADDNAVNREVLVEAMQRLGATITCAENGAQAVAAARDGAFDIILMDCSMPVLDGFAATQAIRAWERSQQRHPTPIIALTAHVRGAEANAWRDAGMTDYLTKPYTLKSLSDCLLRALPQSTLDAMAATASTTVATAAGEASAHDSQALIDAKVLGDIAEIGAGRELLDRVVRLYVEHAPRALETLITHSEQTEPQAIAESAHALKSLSRNIGARAVAELCDVIEESARRGDIGDVTRHAEALQAMIPATIAALIAATDASTPPRRTSAATA